MPDAFNPVARDSEWSLGSGLYSEWNTRQATIAISIGYLRGQLGLTRLPRRVTYTPKYRQKPKFRRAATLAVSLDMVCGRPWAAAVSAAGLRRSLRRQ